VPKPFQQTAVICLEWELFKNNNYHFEPAASAAIAEIRHPAVVYVYNVDVGYISGLSAMSNENARYPFGRHGFCGERKSH
jgi:hypothetical protein